MADYCIYADGELRIIPVEHWDVAGTGDITTALVWPNDPTKIYDPGTNTIVDDVAGERARLCARLEAESKAAIDGGMVTLRGRVKTAPDDRGLIFSFANAAQVAKASGADFGVRWPMADGSRENHAADQMIAMATAVLLGIAAVGAALEAKEDALNAATTLEALWAIVPRE